MINCSIPAVRLEVRATSHVSRRHRSGALVLDIHDLRFSNKHQQDSVRQGLRFVDVGPSLEPSRVNTGNEVPVLATAEWRRLVLAYAAAGESKATIILSIGSLPSGDVRMGSPGRATASEATPVPRVILSQSSSRHSADLVESTTLVATVDIPSVFVKVSKLEVDGLQLWADDISRITEAAFTSRPTSASSSRDPSLIGSRFFAKSRGSSSSTSDSMSTLGAQRTSTTKQAVIKATVDEGMFEPAPSVKCSILV